MKLPWRSCLRLAFFTSRRGTSSVALGEALVLGIETSCDDTAVCVLSSDRKILSSRRFADREVQRRLGGICPSVSSQQHRNLIDGFIEECLVESGKRLSDLTAVAVSTRPGLVLALKVGADRAVSLCRKGRLPLVGVHHMQAHATVGLLERTDISFPFVVVLLTGGHSLIALARGPANFELLASSPSSSPGECLDKVARRLFDSHLIPSSDLHGGAIIENLASMCSPNGHLRYGVAMPSRESPNFNFSYLRGSYLKALAKENARGTLNVYDYCATVQQTMASYIASKLHHCLEYLLDEKKISKGDFVVVSGGVASNGCVRRSLEKIAAFYGLLFYAPSAKYCTDNAEMIAWNGILLLQQRESSAVIPSERLPPSIFVERSCQIGDDVSSLLPQKPRRRLSLKSVAGDRLVFRCKPLSELG